MTDTETAAAIATLTTQVTALLLLATDTNTSQSTLTANYSSVKNTVENDLNLVDNVPDADKIISVLVAQALANKQETVTPVNLATINGQTLLQSGDIVIAIGATLSVTMQYEARATLRLINASEGDSVYLKLIGELIWQAAAELLDDDETCYVTTINSNVTGQWVLAVPDYNYTELHRLADQDLRDSKLRNAGIL